MSSTFWREFSFPSPVDDILKKDKFTLEELLDEDDVVVDTRSQKEELRNYLTKKETLLRLVDYVCNDPEEGASESTKFRYPAVAFEILTSEVDMIDEQLVTPQILQRFFDFFAREKINTLLANLVIKVIVSLLCTKLTSVIKFMKEHPEFIEHFINHLGCAYVQEFFLRLINVETEFEGKGIHNWLIEIRLLEKIIDRFNKESEKLHSTIASTLTEILAISNPTSPLFKHLMSQPIIDKLYSHMLADENSTSSFRWGMSIINEMLHMIGIAQNDIDSLRAPPYDPDTPLDSLPYVVQVTLNHLPRLNSVLSNPNPNKKVITSQSGQEIETFGFLRLVVLQCMEDIIELGFREVTNALVSNHIYIFKNSLDLMFKFSTNTFCHKSSERIFLSCISQIGGDSLLLDLVRNTNLAATLVKKDAEDREGKGTKTLNPYMPFLHNIAYLIQEKARSHLPLSGALGSVEGWSDYALMVRQERAKQESNNGGFDDSSDMDDPYHPSSSDDGGDMESNDADDYDTERAEILLTKAEIEALA